MIVRAEATAVPGRPDHAILPVNALPSNVRAHLGDLVHRDRVRGDSGGSVRSGHEGRFRDVGGVHTGVICAAVSKPAGSLAGG